MNLKFRIKQLLEKHHHTYGELASYVGLTEDQLDKVLDNHTIEIRTLESISKAIKVPLYSFFRDHNVQMPDAFPAYSNDLWQGEEDKLRKELSELKQKLQNMQIEMNEKDEMLSALENELKKKSR